MSKKENKETTVEAGASYSSTLKRRRVEEKEVRVVNKPRKMNLVKPKRIPSKTSDYANSALLVFPTDPLGITSSIKAAMLQAGSKIGKDEKTLELVEEVVGICMKHLEARRKQNAELPRLKQRVDTKGTDTQESEGESTDDTGSSEDEVSYQDMVSALKEAGIKPKSRGKDDVTAAYNELKESEGEE